MIDTNNVEKAKRMIKECKDKPIVVIAKDDDFNRKIIEYGRFDMLAGIEKQNKKDSLRQIDSGLNHVLAREAAKNDISIGIDLEEMRKLDKKEKARRIEAIRQNIKICRKARTKIKLLNFKDKKDAFSFFASIGASSTQSKEAISF